jgi:hypothetical protein
LVGTTTITRIPSFSNVPSWLIGPFFTNVHVHFD